MNWRNTLVLLVISVGAAIFVWRVGREWESPDGTESEGRIFEGFKDARPKIDRIDFDRREADSKVDLVKKGEEHWELTHPIAYRADPWRARGLLSALEFLKSENVLTGTAEKPLDLEEYGLGEGFEKAVTVNLYAGEEKLYGIRFGDVTTDEEKVYAAVEGRDEVYVVKKHALEDFTKKVAHYRSTKVVFFESAEVSKLVVRKAGADPVEMVKEGGIWKMSAPIADRGSYDAVRGLLDLIEST